MFQRNRFDFSDSSVSNYVTIECANAHKNFKYYLEKIIILIIIIKRKP